MATFKLQQDAISSRNGLQERKQCMMGLFAVQLLLALGGPTFLALLRRIKYSNSRSAQDILLPITPGRK